MDFDNLLCSGKLHDFSSFSGHQNGVSDLDKTGLSEDVSKLLFTRQ